MSSYILGLHQGHDAAITLLRDGEPVFALAEERVSREKHDSRFPRHALDLALKECGISLRDLSAVAVTPTVGTVDGVPPYLTQLLTQQGITDLDIHVIGHHLSHAASAYYPSGFESALVFTSDGRGGPAQGGMESYCLFQAHGQSLKTLWRQSDSLFSFGGFYGAVASAALGNKHIDYQSSLEDAGKGMGLAPYGSPQLVAVNGWSDAAIDAVLDDYGRIDPPSGAVQFSNGPIPYGHDLSKFRDQVYQPILALVEKLTGLQADDKRIPHMAMYFAQRWFENTLLTLVDYWLDRSGLSHLCLAGGCALNSVANARVAQLPRVKGLFVQPACGDSGVALGAALLAANRILQVPRCPAQLSDALGKAWCDADIETELVSVGAAYRRLENPADEAAAMLADGKIVGWFDGRDEFGPRALGQRSILADPRHAEIKDALNTRVKFRESFRPFAPIAPAEAAAQWFEVDDSPAWTPLDYMLVVPQVREECRERIPGATHVDGSGRLQQVHADRQPRLHRLLTHFGELTGVPVLINTSFNLKGQPIVHTPRQAWDCFVESRIDALFVGPFLVTEKPLDADQCFENARRSEQLYRALMAEDHATMKELLDGEWTDRLASRPSAAAHVGLSLHKIGRSADAVRVATAQVQRDPTDSNAAAILFHLLPSVSGQNGAPHLETALLSGGGSFESVGQLFQYYMQTGNQAAAQRFMGGILTLKPEITLSLSLPQLPVAELLAGDPRAAVPFIQFLWAIPGPDGVSRAMRTILPNSAPEDALAIADFLGQRFGDNILEADLNAHFEKLRSSDVSANRGLVNWFDRVFENIVDE